MIRFFDFLVPGWRRRDPVNRLAAVIRTRNEETLIRVAVDDPESIIREVAASRLRTNEAGIRVFKRSGNEEVKEIVIKNVITDQDFLWELVESKRRLDALHKITNPSHLVSFVVRNDNSCEHFDPSWRICESALALINSPSHLRDIAMRASGFTVRCDDPWVDDRYLDPAIMACQKLQDPEMLLEIAETCLRPHVADFAAQRAKSLDLNRSVKSTLKGPSDAEVRGEVPEKSSLDVAQNTNDANRLTEMALTDDKANTQQSNSSELFEGKLDNSAKLDQIIHNEACTMEQLIDAAVKLRNEKWLYEEVFASQNIYIFAKQEAVLRIDDHEILQKILGCWSQSEPVRIMAAEKLNRDDIILEIALDQLKRDSPNRQVLNIAFRAIKNEEMIAKLVSTEHWVPYDVYNEQLNQDALLIDVARKAKTGSMRKWALRKLARKWSSQRE